MYITPFPATSLTKLLLQWIAFLSYLRIPIKAMEFNSIHHLFPKLSSPCSHPLFSIIVTLYTLILLYIPSFFISIALSPVLNSTGIILISLLRLGVNNLEKESRVLDSSDNERLAKESNSLESRVLDCNDNHSNLISYSKFAPESKSLESRLIDFLAQNQTHAEFDPKSGLDLECNETHVKYEHDMGLEFTSTESPQAVEGGPKIMETGPKQVDTTMAFLEWNMRAPLEIIYEAYEGEEEDDEESNENHEVSNDKHDVGYERYPSLLMYYPDSETDSSSDGDFPMNEKWETHESVFFKWEDEGEEREELIEISLDHYGKRSIECCHVEEDNLIEIDLFGTRS